MAVIFIILGLFFVGLDFYAPSAIAYPAYQTSTDIGTNIQKYITQHILSDHVRIDIFPDVVGCLFLLIGITMLVRHSRKFIASYLLIIILGTASVAMTILPFFTNGKYLVVPEFLMYGALIVVEILMEFLVLNGVVDISNALPNQSTNKRMQFGWWLTIFCRVFIFSLRFAGLIAVMRVYQVILAPATVFYLWQMFQSRKYIGATHREKGEWRNKLLEERD